MTSPWDNPDAPLNQPRAPGGLSGFDRRLARWWAPLAGVLAVVLVVGLVDVVHSKISDDKSTVSAPSPAPTPTPSPRPTTPKPTAPPKPGSSTAPPQAFFVAPDGFIELPDTSTSSTGPINLDKAAKIDAGSSGSVATSRKLLQREGFTRGYIRGWGNIDGDALLEFVYEWKSPADARRYARGAAVAAKSRPKYHAERSPVAGGYALTYFDKYTFHSVSFAVGRRTFLVNFGVQHAGDALAPLAATARALDRKAIATGA